MGSTWHAQGTSKKAGMIEAGKLGSWGSWTADHSEQECSPPAHTLHASLDLDGNAFLRHSRH